jgi:hypothetical protein
MCITSSGAVTDRIFKPGRIASILERLLLASTVVSRGREDGDPGRVSCLTRYYYVSKITKSRTPESMSQLKAIEFGTRTLDFRPRFGKERY